MKNEIVQILSNPESLSSNKQLDKVRQDLSNLRSDVERYLYLKDQTEQLSAELMSLREEHSRLISSRFFKLWSFYGKLKKIGRTPR